MHLWRSGRRRRRRLCLLAADYRRPFRALLFGAPGGVLRQWGKCCEISQFSSLLLLQTQNSPPNLKLLLLGQILQYFEILLIDAMHSSVYSSLSCSFFILIVKFLQILLALISIIGISCWPGSWISFLY